MRRFVSFKPDEMEKITSRFGEPFYNKVLKDIDVYAERWALSAIQFVPSYSANLVFTCYSENYGDAVLKIGNPTARETVTEYHALLEYDGRRFCKVFDADAANGIILEERIRPGTPLRDESSLEKRVDVFCTLFQGLHQPPEQADVYPTYIDWVCKITEYMSTRDDCKQFYVHMKKAKELCLSVSALYSQKMLLHGDFHHDNILLGSYGAYRIIDPKGVIGDPVFDVPRFLLNEFGDEITSELRRKMERIIRRIEDQLHIPNNIVRQCLYVETAMGICWCLEDGSRPDEFPKLMEHIVFAESILNS